MVARPSPGYPARSRSLRVMRATVDDRAVVRALLGREPLADFEVVVRAADRSPVVIRNAPLTGDGTPMPTRYWLVDPAWTRAVSRLEAAGGVREAESVVDATAIAAAHRTYAAERDAEIRSSHDGPRPSGGVGGTRLGVKCLHAHVAWYLAGGPDPVGEWAVARIEAERDEAEPDEAERDEAERDEAES